MSSVLVVVLVYLLVVLLVGRAAERFFSGTSEDFFVASRSIGSFVLLMTVFGTHMTAFTLLGASSEAHLQGIVVFALMGSSSAIVAPLVLYFVGTRSWWLGKRHGFLTQVQFFRERYQSEAVGLVLFVVLIGLLLPYVLIGVKGAGDVLWALTGAGNGGLPPWVGSLVMCGVILLYVAHGGMRSTAWANTFQTLFFMTFGAIALFVVLDRYGGLGHAFARLSSDRGELLAIGKGSAELRRMVSYLLIPLSVGVFPHVFSHWLTAKSARTFRIAITFYPLCIAIVWVPSVVLGVVGNIDFPPPLEGPVLVHLILRHASGLLAGLLAAGVLAAIMSSVDSQTLAAGTLFTQDIVRHFGFHDRLSESKQVLVGRIFVTLFLVVVFGLSQITTRSIFNVGTWSLSGFAGLFPVLLAALFWKRSTAAGALAGIFTVTILWTAFFWRSTAGQGEYTVFGFLPVVYLLLGSTTALVVASLVTSPPQEDVLRKFFPELR
ncbi:MAG TPA: sodium:solute symporter family protein [Vicinamibacteria bacterium]|nr:sodium:solute symporter family protein [Vicinamibacteria bacterium]